VLLTSLQQRLVKNGGRLIQHAHYYWLLLAEGRSGCGAAGRRGDKAQSGVNFNDNTGAQGQQNRLAQRQFLVLGARQTRRRLLPAPLKTRGPKRAKTLPTDAVQSIEGVGIGEVKTEIPDYALGISLDLTTLAA